MARSNFDHNIKIGLLSTNNAAHILQLSQNTIRKWVLENRIRGAFRMPDSSEIRIPAPSLIEFLRISKMPVPALLHQAAVNHRDYYNEDGSARTENQTM